MKALDNRFYVKFMQLEVDLFKHLPLQPALILSPVRLGSLGLGEKILITPLQLFRF